MKNVLFTKTGVNKMGLELDTLSRNDDTTVIYCNTTGNIAVFGCDLDDFKKVLSDVFSICEGDIKDFFGFDELQEFFDEFDIEYDEKELKRLLE